MITEQTLGTRIKAARLALDMTQSQLGKEISLSRVAVNQIENAKRSVSSKELEAIARVLHRDLTSFFEPTFEQEDILEVLFRADGELIQDKHVAKALQNCVSLGHELSNLESLLHIDRTQGQLMRYDMDAPRNRWHAIEQGEHAAYTERQRLGLADLRVGDLTELLESQGVKVGMLALPDRISGINLCNRTMGCFVVVNQQHHWLRQRFSLAHEYAHVLLDWQRKNPVSDIRKSTDLLEIRANAFAAEFLMPTLGVKQYVNRLGKGHAARSHAAIYDEHGALCIDQRSSTSHQRLQTYDLVLLSQHFCVSRTAMLYRLKNLRLITDTQLKAFLQLEDSGVNKEVAAMLEIDKPDAINHTSFAFNQRFLSLALEAYRRDAITESKLIELAKLVDTSRAQLQKILALTQLQKQDDEARIPS